MGDQAEDILLSFQLTEEEAKTYSTVVEKFQNYFVRRRNISYERSKFNQQYRSPGKQSIPLSQICTNWRKHAITVV